MLVLDTHIWIWLVLSPNKLTKEQMDQITDNIGELYVSIVSIWEVVMLVHKGRLDLHVSLEDWFEDALSRQEIGIISLDIPICIESYALPGDLHGDPMDRMIVATARVNKCPLVTADGKIRSYPHIETI